MKNIRQLFHTLSYLQYPLVLIAFFYLVKPLFKGFGYLSAHPDFLFNAHSKALVLFGVTLSFSALQDTSRTSLRFEKKIWRSPKKAKRMLLITLTTAFLFFASGLWGFFATESFKKEFAYGSVVLAVGILGYLKFQLDIFDTHKKDGREERS